MLPEWAIAELKRCFSEEKKWRAAMRPVWTKLGIKPPSSQELYDMIHDIEDRRAPCGKEKRFEDFWGGYRFCGRASVCRCAAEQVSKSGRSTWNAKTSEQKTEIRNRGRKTMMARHGVEFTAQSDELKQKMVTTNIKRYGCENPLTNPDVRNRIANTMVEKYGVANPSHSTEITQRRSETNAERYGGSPLSNDVIRAKGRDTNLVKYGVEHAQQSDETKDRTKKTVRERYGVDYLQQAPELRGKRKQALIARYGVETPLRYPAFEKKRKETTRSRYGVDHASQAGEVKAKTRQTNIARYGVPISSLSPIVKNKMIQTNLEKYGKPFTAQKHYLDGTLDSLQDKDYLQNELLTKSVQTISQELGVHPVTVYKYCKSHEISMPKSSYEAELSNFVTGLGIRHDMNVRSINGVSEVDLHIDSANIAIEFNGLYWHSDIFKKKSYHREKYEACCNAGIRLLMINEDEWNYRGDAIRSTIRHLLGKSERGLPARKLKLHNISQTVANQFFSVNHIQGVTGKIEFALGAFEENELVGAMAFNRQRGTNAIELIRFCTDHKSRAGLFSRMFKHSVMQTGYREILSFADLRYSTGDVYRNNGWVQVKEIPPDYRYVVGSKTFHKSSYTRKKLYALDETTIGMTERQATEYLGIPRIYDCGKLKFVWQALRFD